MARLHAWAGCSLELHAYHLLYVAAVTALVVGGSLWAWAFDTSGYHLRFGHLDPLDLLHLAPSSSPTAHSRFLPPPYLFAQKHNPFNVYFVKLGWAWNIALWAVQFLLLRATYSVALKERDLRRRRRLDKLVRHKYRQLRRQLEAENASADPLVDESLSRVQGASSVVQLHPGDLSIASTTSPRRRQLQPQQQEMLLKQALAVLHKERERERHQGPQFVTAPFRASITRLVLATACWFIVTRWFFGPAIAVRVYQWTAVDSAYCTNPGKLITADSHPQFFQEGDRIAARVAAGGGMTASWKGGHDVSGHTFLLVLSILWLLEEVTPFLPYLLAPLEELYPAKTWWPANPFVAFSYAASALGLAAAAPAAAPRTPPPSDPTFAAPQPQIQISSPDLGAITIGSSPSLQTADGFDSPAAQAHVGVGAGVGTGTGTGVAGAGGGPPPELVPVLFSPAVHSVAVALVLALVGIWMWMLLMTQIFFHTAREKLSGLAFGIGAWLIVRLFTPKA